MRRGGIFDSAAGRLERLTSARASHLFVTFRRGSFFFFFFAVALVHGKIHPGRGEEEKKLSHPVFLSSAHTPLPSSSSLSLSFSSQRHKDIFILHKARTLMKHRRHKYISMIFFFLFFPLSNLAPTAAAVTHFSVSVCCCEHKLSEYMRVKITPSVSVNVTHLKIV